jgi:putative ABC transport system permease protein
MKRLAELFRRIFHLRQRSDFRHELTEEMQHHLALKTEENIRAGMSEKEARYAAQREFGNVTLLNEDSRGVWNFRWLEQFLQDLRYGARMLRKSPGFTIVTVLTLALGIGANTAVFSLVNGVLLRPLPYSQPDRLVAITDVFPQGAVVAMPSHLKTMDVAAYYEGMEFNLTGRGEASRLYGTAVSADLFSVLAVKPALGRVFVSGEDQPGRDKIVMLSHALWQTEFSSDPNVVGRQMALDGQNREIVGVMPADFQFPSQKTQLWVPVHLDPRNVGNYWGGGFMPVIGRLRAGVTLAQAHTDLRSALPQLRAMFPWKMPDALWSGAVVLSLQQQITGDVQTKLYVLLGAICLVLLIACANVANLLLARGITRQREIAVRAALGADRRRIFRQLLTESALLGICGGALGIFLAVDGLKWLKAILPADTPRLASINIDWRVLAFTAAIALITGVISGLAPAVFAGKLDLTESLKKGGQHTSSTPGSSHGLRSALAIAEISLAFVLVIGAGLLVKSLWELLRVDPGFQTDSVISARITPNSSYCAVPNRCRNFYDELTNRVLATPGVKDAALVNALPLDGRIGAFAADMEDHPRNPSDPAPVIFDSLITPNYLHVMGIPLLAGRALAPADSAPDAAPVALVTAWTAAKFWPNQNPIGKHVKRTFMNAWVTIVGVVGDVHQENLTSKYQSFIGGAIYEPYGVNVAAGRPRPADMTIVLRVLDNNINYAQSLRQIVAGLNPEAPVSDIATLRSVVTKSASSARSTVSLFAVFAVLALALAAIGIYGVISYSVTQRRPEIGMRMALGAQWTDIFRLIVGHGMRLALIGIAIGVAAAIALTRLMKTLLFGVTATDSGTFIGVSILVILVAVAACYIPARRAMRVDPMVALRHD